MKHPREAAAALALVSGAVALTIWRSRIGADFWPPDASRVGPNLVAEIVQDAFLIVLAVLIYPPFRRALHRFIDRKLHGLNAKVDTHLALFKAHHRIVKAEHQRAEEHREWQHRAHLAQLRGEEPPDHPHYPKS